MAKRKIGGVRKVEPRRLSIPEQVREEWRKARREPADLQAPLPTKRKIGGVKAVPRGTTVGHRQCDECEGQLIGEMWIHSARCPRTVILWKAHGYKETDWTSGVYRCCEFGCDPQPLPSGWTHHWRCPFWNEYGITPFDAEASVDP